MCFRISYLILFLCKSISNTNSTTNMSTQIYNLFSFDTLIITLPCDIHWFDLKTNCLQTSWFSGKGSLSLESRLSFFFFFSKREKERWSVLAISVSGVKIFFPYCSVKQYQKKKRKHSSIYHISSTVVNMLLRQKYQLVWTLQ